MTTPTTSAPQGAATDASAASSTATSSTASAPAQEQAPKSTRERMLEHARSMQTAPSSKDGSPPAADASKGVDPASSPGKADDTQKGEQRSDEDNVADKKKQPDHVPMAVFKGRLAEQKQKTEAAQAEVQNLKLATTKYEKAVELLSSENERLKAQLREGRAFNETEEQLAETQLTMKSKELAAELQKQHEESLRQMTAKIKEEQELEVIRTSLDEQVTGAIAKYPLVSREELIHFMMKDKRAKPATASELARLITAKKEEKLKAQGYTRQQISSTTTEQPVTVSGPTGGGGLGRFSNDRKGMLEYARSIGAK